MTSFVRYIDPSYIIRSVPANVEDSLYCANLGQNAVHAAMAGKTSMMVSLWNDKYVHVPNVLPVAVVLGTMGWFNIPLDMMTITIASITIGISVDDTIHYIHRFQKEFVKDRNYLATLYRCHCSIGRALFYTTVTITIGFSILVLSHFIPTIYFGLFTGFAMLVALLGDLTMLPQLLITLKPLGPEANNNDVDSH